MFDDGCPTLESGVLGFLYIMLRDVITSVEPILTHLPVSIAMQLVFTCTCNLSVLQHATWLRQLVFVVNNCVQHCGCWWQCRYTCQLTDLPCLHILLVATAVCGYFSTNYVTLLTALPAVSKRSIPITWLKWLRYLSHNIACSLVCSWTLFLSKSNNSLYTEIASQPTCSWQSFLFASCCHWIQLAATLRGSRPGLQSASLIMASLMTS